MARTKKKARKSTGPFYSKMFLEEALNFSPRKGGGYYQAVIHQKLDGDKYEIIRKLGYGRRSSTWLVLRARDPEYFAVEIFTVAASERANTAELPIIKEVDKVSRSSSLELPTFHGSFWEESRVGSHLRFVVNPLSTSVKDLQLDVKNQRLPVHVVQRIIWSVSNSLNGLHDVKIMHGRTFLIHDLFHPGVIFNPLLKRKTYFSQLRPKSNTFSPSSIQNLHHPLWSSRNLSLYCYSLRHSFIWNDKRKAVVDWPIYLNNLGYGKACPLFFFALVAWDSYHVFIAQQWNYKPEENEDYLSAPETLLQSASCSLQTDIWMLGCLVSRAQWNLFVTLV